LEPHEHHATGRPRPGLAVARDVHDARVLEDRDVEVGGRLGLGVEPQKWRDGAHSASRPCLDAARGMHCARLHILELPGSTAISTIVTPGSSLPSVVTPDRFAQGRTFEEWIAYIGTPENLRRDSGRGARRVDYSEDLRQAFEKSRLTEDQTAALHWLVA